MDSFGSGKSGGISQFPRTVKFELEIHTHLEDIAPSDFTCFVNLCCPSGQVIDFGEFLSLFTCSQPFFGGGEGVPGNVWMARLRTIARTEARFILITATPLKFYCAPGRGNYLQSGMGIEVPGIMDLARLSVCTHLTYVRNEL
jgi:hypothetical protein